MTNNDKVAQVLNNLVVNYIIMRIKQVKIINR